MRFFPILNQNIYHFTKNGKTIIGLTNNLKELFKYKNDRSNTFKLELHNENIGKIVYPTSTVTKIYCSDNQKTYKFESPCIGKIVGFNQKLNLNPNIILQNSELKTG